MSSTPERAETPVSDRDIARLMGATGAVPDPASKAPRKPAVAKQAKGEPIEDGRLSTRLKPELKTLLELYSTLTGTSQQEIVNAALDAYLSPHAQQLKAAWDLRQAIISGKSS